MLLLCCPTIHCYSRGILGLMVTSRGRKLGIGSSAAAAGRPSSQRKLNVAHARRWRGPGWGRMSRGGEASYLKGQARGGARTVSRTSSAMPCDRISARSSADTGTVLSPVPMTRISGERGPCGVGVKEVGKEV